MALLDTLPARLVAALPAALLGRRARAPRFFRVTSALQARHAARQTGARTVDVEGELLALLERGGTTVFLWAAGARAGLPVVLGAGDEHVVRLEVDGQPPFVVRVDEVAPGGAYTGPAAREVPLLHHLPQSEPCVLAFAADLRRADVCEVRVPGFVTHATVASAQEVAARLLPLGGTRGETVVRFRF